MDKFLKSVDGNNSYIKDTYWVISFFEDLEEAKLIHSGKQSQQ